MARALEEQAAGQRFPREFRALAAELHREWAEQAPVVACRHRDIFVVVPVADRPRMIRGCLLDLLEECRTFRYPETGGGRIGVIIVEDGAEPASWAGNRGLAEELSTAGLPAVYWGFEEQERCLSLLPAPLRVSLRDLGAAAGQSAGPRKGAAATRNLASLVLAAALAEDSRSLVWFVDSDQFWQTAVLSPTGGREDVRGYSFFHRMDLLFADGEVDIVTAHVTGDPPVSPAVMARCFAEDLLASLAFVKGRAPGQPCPFHGGEPGPEGHDAAYHDFGVEFGYRRRPVPERWVCRESGPHSVETGLEAYGRVLNGFFFGHHPTRQTLFDPTRRLGETGPARTVYTGNVVIGPGARDTFLPFAELGLRMAGPVLGRILRVRYGSRFVKTNLPLLHRRILPGEGVGEHRAGLTLGSGTVPDLSVEFFRQFWGDVLLFAVEDLCRNGYPAVRPPREEVEGFVEARRRRIAGQYRERTGRLEELCRQLSGAWDDLSDGKGRIRSQGFANALSSCLDALTKNFSYRSPVIRAIGDRSRTSERSAALVRAILELPDQQNLWREAIQVLGTRGVPAPLPLASSNPERSESVDRSGFL